MLQRTYVCGCTSTTATMGTSASSVAGNDAGGGSTVASAGHPASLWGKDLSASVALPPAVLDLFERELRRLTRDVDRDFIVLNEITSIRFEGRDQGSDESRRWSTTAGGSVATAFSVAEAEAGEVEGAGAESASQEHEQSSASDATATATALLSPPVQPPPSPPSLLSGLPLDFHLDMQHLVRSV